MDNVKISVIITAYNIERYISECIESVQKQNFDEIEIICVDDCSADGTIETIKRYMTRDERIKLVKLDDNGGPAKARNAGCRAANGKYIYFLDGDDYLRNGMLAKLYSISEENNLDVLSFSGEAFVDEGFIDGAKYEASKDSYKRRTVFDGVYTGPELYAEYMDRGENNGNLYLQFIRRSLYIENNLYANDDLRYDNDSPFGIYMFAKRAMCIPDVFYMRRYRPDSRVTGKRTFEKAECIMLRLFLELELWQSMKLPDKTNKSIEKHFLIAQRSLRYMLQGVDTKEREFNLLLKYPAVKYIMDYFILDNPPYPSLTNAVIDKLRDSNNVVLYGAGMVAEDVAKYLEKMGITHYIPVVTKKKEDQIFRGRTVYESDEININWESTIAITAVSKKFRGDIVNSLIGKRAKEVVIIQ